MRGAKGDRTRAMTGGGSGGAPERSLSEVQGPPLFTPSPPPQRGRHLILFTPSTSREGGIRYLEAGGAG